MFSQKILSLGVLPLFLLGGTLCAGEPGSEEIPVFEAPALEFVVSALRSPESPEKIPASVQIITAEEIEKSGAASVVQLFELSPAIQIRQSLSGTGSEMVSMRGFGDNSFLRVLILVDGHKLNDPDMNAVNWSAIPLYDIDHIEIYDGPASVQYGDRAVGGVINIITKKAAKTATAMGMSVSPFRTPVFFSHQRRLSQGSLSLTAERIEASGYRDRQAGTNTLLSARGSYDPSASLSLGVNWSFTHFAYELPGSLTKAQFEDDPTQAVNLDDDAETIQISSGLSLFWQPAEGLSLNIPGQYRYKQVKSNMSSWFMFSDTDIHAWDIRPALNYSPALGPVGLQVTAGLDTDGAVLRSTPYDDRARTLPAAFSTGYTVTTLSIAPYIITRITPLKFLTLSLGGRYDAYWLDAQTEDLTVKGGITHNAWVYSAGLTINPIPSLKLYANYGTLFRYPAVDEQVGLYSGGSFDMDLKPETGFNAEGGIAYQYNEMIDVKATVYFMQLKDELWLNPMLSPPFGANANMISKTERTGVNASIDVQPTRFIRLQATYNFIRSRIKEFPFAGNAVPMVPAHSVFAKLAAVTPFGLEFGPSFTYTAASYQINDFNNDQEKTDATYLLGIFAQYSQKFGQLDFSAQFKIDNLLDRKYSPYVVKGSSNTAYYPADGRSVQVSVIFRF